MKKKVIYAGIILAVLGLAIFGGVRYSQARAASTTTSSVQTATVTKGTVSTSVLASGTVKARQSATLAWQVSGTVKSVTVNVGDVVTTSQVLATLDPTSIPATVLSAQAELASAQKNLDDLLNSQVAAVQAKQALETAQQAVDDYSINFPFTQAAAQAALITAQTNLTTMQNRRDALNNARASDADINAATAAYILAQQSVDVAQKAVNQTAKLGENDPMRAQALTRLSDAEKKRDAALATLNWYQGKPTDTDIATADANLAQAKATLAQAQSTWDRIKAGPNATDLELLKAKLADAQRAYDRIKDGPDQADVIAAQAKLAAAQSAINQDKIIAPFSGVVTEVDMLPGDQATSGKTAIRIDQLDHLLVDVQITEVDIPNLKVNQPATMTFDAISGKTYKGKVTTVAMVGTSTQGVVQYTVTVEMTNPDANVKSGMTASLSIITQSKSNVLVVPNKAIHSLSGQKYVLVLLEGKQTQVPVTVGLTDDSKSEVTPAVSASALAVGDEVVITSSSSTKTTTTTNNNPTFGGGDFGGPPAGDPGLP